MLISIETILSCRLVLNLRRMSRVQSGQNTLAGQASGLCDLQFTSNAFLGNIGAPLRSIDEEWDDFDGDINDETSG